MPKRWGQHTIALPTAPAILGYATVGGKKEGEGPLGAYLDVIYTDARLGMDTWEQAESGMQRRR